MAPDPATSLAEHAVSPTADDDAAARRPLVPTERQRARGETAPEYGFHDADDRTERASIGRRIAAASARYDLRTLAGPKMPAAVILFIAFFGVLDDLVFTVIGPEIRTDLAGSAAVLGAVAFVAFLVPYVVEPFYGWLVDRVSRVTLLRIAHIGGNVVSATSAFAANLLGFVGARASAQFLGLGAQTPSATLVADYYEGESFGRVMTMVPAVHTLATVVGPALAGVLVSATNWRVAVFVMGCTAVVASLATFLLREPARGEAERRALGAPRDTDAGEPLSFSESWRAARSIHTLRRIWYATPFQVPGRFFPMLLVLGLYYAETFALSAAQRGYVATLFGGSGLIGLFLVTPVAGRLLASQPGRLMGLAGGLMVVQALGTLVLAVSPSALVSILAAIPLGFASFAVPPLVQMVTLKVVPPRIRGLGASTTAPWALLGVVLFALALAAPSYRVVMVTLTSIFVVGGVLLATAGATVRRDMRAAAASVLAHRVAREAKESGRSKLLVCRGVEAAYGGVPVLFGVDLDIDQGEVLALLGTNGAGKSTLLRVISGVHHASGGAVLLDGQDVTHEPAHANARRGIVTMPGGKATFPALTVRENLRAAAWLYRDDEEYVSARMDTVLSFFPPLRQRLDDACGNLSGGEQQMVGLAQAFLMRPRLLMVDELSLGLAPAVVDQLLAILRAIREQGTTIVLVEQSVNVALTIAQRAVFMEKGEIRFDGPTAELLRRPDLIRSVFIGGASAGRPAARAGRRPSRRVETADDRPTLAVEDVAVRFGGVEALRAATLSIGSGEIVGIIGPNGAGKTTLFDVISGFVAPDRGRVFYGGTDITDRSAHERARLGIGRSFQHVRLFPALTVRQNIAVALDRRAVRSEAMDALWLPQVRAAESRIFRRVEGLIEIVGLEPFADKFARELSTGTRRAVEVACMIAAEPSVLLLDEPSAGLAQAETEELGPVLTRLVRDTGAALLVIEHDIPLVTSIADRLVAMDLGAVIASGSPAEVMQHPDVLASYLSASGGVIARSGMLQEVAAAMGHHDDRGNGWKGP